MKLLKITHETSKIFINLKIVKVHDLKITRERRDCIRSQNLNE